MKNVKQNLGIVGHVKIFQMDEDRNIIPGTTHEGKNTIQDAMFKYLAKMLGANAFEVETIEQSETLFLQENCLYQVATASVTFDGDTYPVGSYLLYDGSAITFGSGVLKRVKTYGMCNLLSSSINKLTWAGDLESDGVIGKDCIVISEWPLDYGDNGISEDVPLSVSNSEVEAFMKTELNQGGDGDETYIEFYGEVLNDGSSSITLGPTFSLCHNITDEELVGTNSVWVRAILSEYSYETSLVAGRRLGIYWKFSFAEQTS